MRDDPTPAADRGSECNDLLGRLEAHACMHDDLVLHDPEQKQWAADLRAAKAEIERLRAELAEAVTALPQAVRNERERCIEACRSEYLEDPQPTEGDTAYTQAVADRYRVVRGAFWWRVKIGDGQQTVGRCYTEAEAERLAAALRTAFLDGAFVVAQQVAEEQRLRDAIKGLGELVREQSRSRITPVPHA